MRLKGMRFVLVAVLISSVGVVEADRVAEPAQQQMGPRIKVPPRPPPPPVRRVYQPPPEIGKLAKELEGVWACKGVVLAGDGSSQPLVGTLASKLELGGAWIEQTFGDRNQAPRFVAFRTYDATARQWTRAYFDSTAGRVEQTSLGETGGLWTWTGTSTTPTGTFEARDYEQRDGAQLKMWGELMLGGQWQKAYEVTCKK